MASVIPIVRAKGTVYRALVRIRRDGAIVQSATATHATESKAWKWAYQTQAALEQRADALPGTNDTMGDLIRRYLAEFGAGAGRTKTSHLKLLLTFRLASLPNREFTADLLIEHIRQRRKTVQPATALNDLVWLRNVTKAAASLWGAPARLHEAVETAMFYCTKYALVAKSNRRERRPTQQELGRLTAYFKDRDERAQLPMNDIMWFAVHSARRQEEITRLLRSDNIEADRTGVVRDLKHPRKKKGNHKVFKYTPEAWEIVKRQPVTGDVIFPYNPKTVGTVFRQACRILEIVDLHFHDLRHEATSRLFESKKRYTIPEVQMFTLHQDWKLLQRYTQLRPADVA